jgi:hypothetical protein
LTATFKTAKSLIFKAAMPFCEMENELRTPFRSSGRSFTPVSGALNTPSEPFEAYLKGV